MNNSNINPIDNNNDDDEIKIAQISCPVFDILMSSSKPFGMIWEDDKMMDFLKKRGYSILKRTDDNGDTYEVAIKNGEKTIPDYDNICETFEDEVQDILINWLLKIG